MNARPLIAPGSEPTMTLTTLRDRLSAIIAENERLGCADRNACPVVIEIRDNPASGALRDHTRWLPVSYAGGGLMGLPEGDCVQLIAYTSKEVGKTTRETRRRRA